MSLATSTVDMCRTSAPLFRRQPLPEAGSAARRSAPVSAAVSGSGSEAMQRVELLGVRARQRVAGADAARVEADDVEATRAARAERGDAGAAYSTPDAPGPPGFTTIEPSRRRALVAGTLSTCSLMVRPCGFA